MLRIWLPLNGDLHNQGCSNVTVTNNGATVNTNGKIGSCYYFNASSYLYENTYDWTDFNTSQFSLCCWYKQPSPVASGNSQMICIGTSSGWNNIRIGLLRRTSNGYPMFSVSDGSSAVNYNCTATKFPLDTWNHIVCTYNAGEINIYLNGEWNKSYTTTIVPVLNSSQHLGIGAASNGAEKLTGYLNDIRIYDHALSAAEVKEISQGLVLHYKLDSGYNENTVNLAAGVIGYNYISKDVAQYATTIQGKTAYGNKIFTYSAYIKNTSDHPLAVRFNPYNAADTSYTAFNGNYIQPGQEGRSIVTVDITDTSKWNGKVILYIQNGNAGTVPTNKTFYIKEVQVEEKNHATPFTPNTRNNTIIQDSSGYNHNGTILNTVSISSDTPRYSYSTKLEAANSMINCGRGGMVIDSITVNLWVKSSSWANPVSCTEGGGWNFEADGDYFRFPIYISGVGYKYGKSVHTRAQICNNQWHMLTGIYDRINQKVQIYVDGQLDNDYAAGTSNNIGYNGSNVIWLGAEATGSNTTASNGMAGLFSDFRIYATALSADDILQLYHTSAKIDNKKNLHTYELIENSSSIKINKRGQTLCNELQERTAMKFYKTDSIIETNVLNEF